MAPFATPRRTPWLPAAILLAAATLGGVTVAWLLGAHAWWAYLGVVLGVILGLGAAERFLAPDLEAAAELVRCGALCDAAGAICGTLE